MHRKVVFFCLTALCLVGLFGASLPAQDAFPPGIEGEFYICPRIDLNPASKGGPLTLNLDGELDDTAWTRAAWHHWSVEADTNPLPRGDTGIPPELDNDLEWAALADQQYLYIAWRIPDDVIWIGEQTQCNVWQDDSVEIYIDAKNDGPICATGTERCYNVDDAQLTIGLDNDGKTDPNELVIGGVAGKGACDFSGPHPDLCRGVVKQNQDGAGNYNGWQGEIAFALETLGNNDDGDPVWTIDPANCTTIGWNIHTNDDDTGGARDHKVMWSKKELTETAWRNPGSFGKLVFFDPSQDLPEFIKPVQNLACARQADGTVNATWSNSPEANPATPIKIFVDGQQLRTIPGSSQSTTFTEQEVPRDQKDHTIGIKNPACSSPVECFIIQAPFDRCGGLRAWNLLGAYSSPLGGAPGEEEIRKDYMTDGQTTELDFIWFPGASIATDFNGAAASTGVNGGASGRNPGGVPTVFARQGLDNSRVIFQNAAGFGSVIDNVMVYAQCYVIADNEMEVFLGMTSDDSIQVILNTQEVWINNTGRGGDRVCTPQDITLNPVTLLQGTNSLIVKIFNGTGDWDFALRFQDADGKPVTSGLHASLSPSGLCILPPLTATRSMNTGETISILCQDRPKWKAGASYDVTLAIATIRGAGAQDCASVPSSVTVVEHVPNGWTPSSPSPGGSVSGQDVTWTLQGASLATGNLTYKVKAGNQKGNVIFSGKIREQGSALTFVAGGLSGLFNPSDFNEQGFVKTMLLLGPYRQRALGGRADPGNDIIRKDYLADGAGITESSITPRDGDIVNTKYNSAAYSAGLATTPNAPKINPNAKPTWKEWRDEDDTIDFSQYYGGDFNVIMMYAVFYVIAERQFDNIEMGLASDDSVQVLLDNQEVWINNIPRGYGGPNEVQDPIPVVSLAPGLHRVMVKVFEGNGGHGFRIRFQDPTTLESIVDGLRICLSPDPLDCNEAPIGPLFRRGDVDNTVAVDITDAINLLFFLFLGQFTVTCQDAADFDDSGAVDITDAVNILLNLFAGGPPAPPPGSANCGVDPTPDTASPDLGCASYSAGC